MKQKLSLLSSRILIRFAASLQRSYLFAVLELVIVFGMTLIFLCFAKSNLKHLSAMYVWTIVPVALFCLVTFMVYWLGNVSVGPLYRQNMIRVSSEEDKAYEIFTFIGCIILTLHCANVISVFFSKFALLGLSVGSLIVILLLVEGVSRLGEKLAEKEIFTTKHYMAL